MAGHVPRRQQRRTRTALQSASMERYRPKGCDAVCVTLGRVRGPDFVCLDMGLGTPRMPWASGLDWSVILAYLSNVRH